MSIPVKTVGMTAEEYARRVAAHVTQCYLGSLQEATEEDRMFIASALLTAAYLHQYVPWVFNQIQAVLVRELAEHEMPTTTPSRTPRRPRRFSS